MSVGQSILGAILFLLGFTTLGAAYMATQEMINRDF